MYNVKLQYYASPHYCFTRLVNMKGSVIVEIFETAC